MKTNAVLQRVEDDATPCSVVSSVLFGISPDMISGGNHVVDLDAKHVEEKFVDLNAARKRRRPQKWVVKMHKS